MPKSRVRKKPVYTPPPTRWPKRAVSPAWLAPTMVACFADRAGLDRAVLRHRGEHARCSATLGGWNLVCGFALIVAGVVLATRWH